MATAPRLNYFDNSGTTVNLVVYTNTSSIYLTGALDADTVDVQISINGSGFISDPTLIGLNLPNFSVPNLNSFPAGLQLEAGLNTIELRAVDISGSVSPVTIASITVSTEYNVTLIEASPTGVVMNRFSDYVEIGWTLAQDIGFYTPTPISGYNVYASTGPGGTGSGYLRLNTQLIPVDNPSEYTESEIDTREVSYDFPFSEQDVAQSLSIKFDKVSSSDYQFRERLYENVYPLLLSPNYRVKLTFSRLEQTRRFKFRHNRNDDLSSGVLNNDTFGFILPYIPIYYVVTAVYVDNERNTMVESRYSEELVGSPLPMDINVRGLRIRDQSVVAQEYIKTLQSVAPELSLIPGSTIREVHIEPFSNEIQKSYFLMDFVNRAKSFPALLAIDDPSNSNFSIPVANSQYKSNLKTALSVPTDTTVQELINNAFDSLAKNFGVIRKGRTLASVNQTFYTTTKPLRDLYVNQGTVVRSGTNPGVPRFMANGQVVLPAASASRYYNYDKKRYEIKVPMIAETAGASGNVPAGSLDSIVSGSFGLLTINEEAAFGGTESQSNLELATESSRVLVSLDTGTAGGYEKLAASIPGVQDYVLVSSGDEYMMRDWDPVRMKHVGGKADIYVKGTIERTINETFAFEFNIARNVRFDVIDPINLVFRARDSRLSVDNPIQEVLFNPSQDLGLFNFSNFPTSAYDLIGVEIVDFRTIRLSLLVPQPDTALDDFITGSYRYRNNNKFTPSVQPVISVSSVVGEISGIISPGNGYLLYKTQDPLIDGESSLANDYVEIKQVDNVPSGDVIIVNDETHVLIGQIEEGLLNIGINLSTILVLSEDRTTIFNGPDTEDPDYSLMSGTSTTAIRIVRTIDSNIPDGSVVSVDYEHDENFEVTYTVNDLLTRLQLEVNRMKHITADVVAKQAIANPLDIQATIQLRPGYEQSTVNNNIRTGYSNLILSREIGEPIHVSDITAVIDNSDGVDFVVQPFAKLTLQNGAQRVRDSIPSFNNFIPSLSRGTNAVYILTDSFPFATVDSGGPENVHKDVFKDNIAMATSPTLNRIGDIVNQAYIIGDDGAVIAGYSDDLTILNSGYTANQIDNVRMELTANKVVVSLDYGVTPADTPDSHSFSVSYFVYNDSGVKDIITSSVEYLNPGNLTLTFRKA